jgi:starch-binding outer membrane protein, SusD/RagB family
MTTTSFRPARRSARAATLLCTLGLTGLVACNLEIANPNAATETNVFTTSAGVRALAVGLQGRWGNAIANAVWVPGLVAGELGVTNASLAPQRAFQQFPDIGAITPLEDNNVEVLNFWSGHYQIVRTADELLASVDNVTLAPGTASGIRALALAMKGYAFGTLSEAWEQIPVNITGLESPFVDRATALTTTLDLLAQARQALETTPASPEFTSQLLAPGIDLPNLIRAWQARYALAAGQHAQALAFANDVPSGASSEFRYATADQSPLWSVFTGLRYFSAQASLVTQAESGDTRVTSQFGATPQASFGGSSIVPVLRFASQTEPYPMFTQDEMLLIRAEALARLARLEEARTPLNTVRTRAGLPARTASELGTQSTVLDEILRQRRYSLFGTGLAWADLRRFGRLQQARVTWLPYPLNERAGNPNTPPNP